MGGQSKEESRGSPIHSAIATLEGVATHINAEINGAAVLKTKPEIVQLTMGWYHEQYPHPLFDATHISVVQLTREKKPKVKISQIDPDGKITLEDMTGQNAVLDKTAFLATMLASPVPKAKLIEYNRQNDKTK